MKNKNVPELIWTLRTAFRSEDFARVEEILVCKETKIKQQIERKKEKIALMQKEWDFHRIEIINLRLSQKRPKKAIESLLEKLKKGVIDYTSTLDQLGKKNNELQDVKNWVEEELVRLQRKKNNEFECVKNWVEEELERSMKSYEKQVWRLEQKVKMLNSTTIQRCNPKEVTKDNNDDVSIATIQRKPWKKI